MPESSERSTVGSTLANAAPVSAAPKGGTSAHAPINKSVGGTAPRIATLNIAPTPAAKPPKSAPPSEPVQSSTPALLEGGASASAPRVNDWLCAKSEAAGGA